MRANYVVEDEQVFSGSQAGIFLALADRIVPSEGPGVPGARSEATLRAAEMFLEGQDRSVKKKLALLLKVFEWGSVLKFGRRFTRLRAESQDAYLHAWEFSKLQLFRFAFSSLRNLILVSFYTQLESWPRIGYPGPVLEQKAVSSRQNAVGRTQ